VQVKSQIKTSEAARVECAVLLLLINEDLWRAA